MAENRFLVPQYIETEPKILGPITVRQFIIILVAGLIDFIIWKIFETRQQVVGLALIVMVSLILGIVAFARINGQGFHYFFLNLVRTFKRPSLKVWRKQIVKEVVKGDERAPDQAPPTKPMPPKSRLSDLALLVDTGGAYNVELNGEQNNKQQEPLDEMNI